MIKLKRLFCKHKYPKGLATIQFISDNLDKEHTKVYLYQNYCFKCGKRKRFLGDDLAIIRFQEKYEEDF